MVVAPRRFELSISADKTGLKLGSITGAFVFDFPENKYAGGADRVMFELDPETRASVEVFYNKCLDWFIEKHKTCSVDESLKYIEESEKKAAEAAALNAPVIPA